MNMAMKKKFLSEYQSMGVETGVSEASPHRLVAMLYEGALGLLAQAKGFIQRKDFQSKAKTLGHATSIINGLRSHLDFEVGGEVALNLDALYEYIARISLEAGRENNVEKLEEAIDLLKTLQEAWEQMPDNFKKATPQQLEMVRKSKGLG